MKRAIPIVLVLLVVSAAAVFHRQIWDFGTRTYEAIASSPTGGLQLQTAIRNPLASGTIEARTIAVGSVTGGRIAALYVAEGQQVAAGELIAELDTTLVDAALQQAQAAAEVAKAQLALLRAGARPADLAVARAAVAQAEAARDAACTAWQDAQALVNAPGELDVKIIAAAAQVQTAQEQLAAAQANATAADLEEQLWGRTVKSLEEGFDIPLPFPGGGSVHLPASADKLNTARLQWNLASQKVWDAHAQATSAALAHDAARQTLADLRDQKQDPQTLKAQADAAEAACRVAQAAVAAAQADLDLLLAGAAAEQLDAASALVDQAAEAVRQWQVKRDQARITAPEAGLVTDVVLRPGEVAVPGSPIVHLADLSQVTLTAYVPEPELGRVQVGQKMGVAVDSFPDRLFEGVVAQIAGQAEFTPKNVQTREERANTVFAVKITLPNPDGVLKPGMPADACDCGLGITDCGPRESSLSRIPQSETRNPKSEITASGTIEATETTISAEVGGRVVAVGASEGDQVTAGQLLVQLDEAEVAAQIAQAEAAVAAARAELARVTAAPQAARVAKAEAQVAQAQAGLAGAQTALENARQARANPQALDAQINSARVQVRQAAAQVDQARARLKAAEVLQQSAPAEGGSDQDRTRRAIYDQNVIAAQALLRAAQAQQSGAQAALDQLLAIRAKPVALEAAVHRAEGQVAQAQAALEVARAALAQVQAAASPEAIALAQAKVTQAEAALALLRAQRSKLAVRSPGAGLVTAQAVHAGEVAQPAAPLYTIVDLSRVSLVIYVPTDRLGLVVPGQTAQVSVDPYPGRRFIGIVTHIADQAEFTPRNVQTQEERVRTVFAVEITLENPDGALRPGMSADAVLGQQR